MDWRILLIILSLSPFGHAQIVHPKDLLTEAERAEMDSIPDSELEIFDTIMLNDAQVLHLNLKTDMEKKYYVWLRRRVRDVWPFVKVAVEEYNSICDTSRYFSSKRERKRYIRHRQQVLADRFEDRLKNLSLSRGQILIKLINRETDRTAYDIIREMRGGVNAFLWNSTGGAFNLDLRKEFDPHRTREDLYIEVILQKDFRTGRLQPIRDSD